jgi:hypothetical protein
MEAMGMYSYTMKTILTKIDKAEEQKKNTFLIGGFPRHYIEAASKAIKNYEVTVVRQSPIGLDFEIRFRDVTTKIHVKKSFIQELVSCINVAKKRLLPTDLWKQSGVIKDLLSS